MNGVMWALINIIGPLVLLAFLVWVFLRNRNRPKEVAKADRGAVQLREELQRDPEYREE